MPVVIVLILAIVFTTIFFIARVNKMKEYKNNIKLSEGFTITAHTGCVNTEENSLDSIKMGVENGADIVEFDLYFNNQGVAVLSHDEPKGDEVTLKEAFEYVSRFENIKVNVDAKTTDNLAQVYTFAQEYNIVDRVFFTGINEEDAKVAKRDCPQISYFLNVDVDKRRNTDREYLLSLVEKVKNAGAIGINFNYKSSSKELVEVFHENGLLVSIWTVDDEYNMAKILSFGPDNITTRHPDKLSEIIK